MSVRCDVRFQQYIRVTCEGGNQKGAWPNKKQPAKWFFVKIQDELPSDVDSGLYSCSRINDLVSSHIWENLGVS